MQSENFKAVAVLLAQAQAAQAAGLRAEAENLWAQIAVQAPGHPKLALRRAQQLIGAKDPRAALGLLNEAAARDSKDPEIPLYLALAYHQIGDFEAAIRAYDATLAIDPYHYLALLSKGAVLEKLGRTKQAAGVYRDALKVAPPDEHLSPSLRGPTEQARHVVEVHARALAAKIRSKTDALRAELADKNLERFEECVDIFAGLKPVFVQQPVLLNFPRLPAIPFFERAQFAWLERLEAATDTIRDELIAVIDEHQEGFRPYVAYPPHVPHRMLGLNHSKAWSALDFWRDGKRNEETCRRCPRTFELLQTLPLINQPGFGPNAMFSVLEAHTRIPPHTGSANTRSVVHLPLILPEKCWFRVGNDVREWKMSKAWVFDDTIEHEAANDSDEVRVILIFDVWNPMLSEAERRLVLALLSAYGEYLSTP
jgi:aspartyl/asparaginyl beta-hydroxylase (cupin superfamily)/predicted TPR repeat methyltransferase